MKVNIIGHNQTASAQPLEVFQYRLDDSSEAVALIAETLRKSYKYPIKTSVQEYLSNARDVHRELNINEAIDVQIPTELNSEFFIRDYGTGLSKEQMQDYITFAKSTKRHSNTATGGFGFGSKSFFSYADSFTIISFYQGVKYIYRASCVRSKEGALTLVSQTKTTEKNGLQVQVAVRQSDRSEFKSAVLRLQRYWTNQKIKILNLNSEEYQEKSKLILSEGSVKVWSSQTDTYRHHNRNRGYGSHKFTLDKNQVFFLVDEIPYGIDNFELENKEVEEFFKGLNSNYRISVSVNTGELTLSKYREYIESTPENKTAIEKMLVKMIQDFRQAQIKKYGRLKISSFDQITEEKVAPYLMLSNETEADFIGKHSTYLIQISAEYNSREANFSYIIKEKIPSENRNLMSASFGRNGRGGTECVWSDSPRGFYLNSDGHAVLLPRYEKKPTLGFYSVDESKEVMRQRIKTMWIQSGNCVSINVISCKKEPTDAEKELFSLLGFSTDLASVERTKPERKPEVKGAKPVVKKVKAPKEETIRYTTPSYRSVYDYNNKKENITIEESPSFNAKLSNLTKNTLIVIKLSEMDDAFKLLLKDKHFGAYTHWGIVHMIVEDDLYEKIVALPNAHCFKKFNFAKMKSNKLIKESAQERLNSSLNCEVKSSFEFKQILQLVAAGLFSESESEKIKELSLIKGQALYLSGIKKAGLEAEYARLRKSHEGIKLIEEYEYLTLLKPISKFELVNQKNLELMKKIMKKMKAK